MDFSDLGSVAAYILTNNMLKETLQLVASMYQRFYRTFFWATIHKFINVSKFLGKLLFRVTHLADYILLDDCY